MKVKELKKFLETVDDDKDVKFITTEWDRVVCETIEIHSFEVEDVTENDSELYLEIENHTFLKELGLH